MAVYGLADLHLSLAAPFKSGELINAYKPMDIFGNHWQDYCQKIYDNWCAIIKPDDYVLVAGDISWAMTMDEIFWDFDFLRQLPGKIILSKGNHDYWWQGIGQLRRELPPNCHALQYSSYDACGKTVCGSRGWLSPDHPDYKPSEDDKIFAREVLRMTMALEEGAKLNQPLVAMLHYPPLSVGDADNEMLALLSKFGVEICLYGHIHGFEAKNLPPAEYQGIKMINISSDRLNFKPKLLWE